MSDTSNAVAHRLREESPTIDAVCRQLERQVGPHETESMVAFAEIFLSKATKEFLFSRSADTLAHIALGAWRFMQDRTPVPQCRVVWWRSFPSLRERPQGRIPPPVNRGFRRSSPHMR